MLGLLSGLKILDFTTLLPGPYATMILADMGAEIIHIEALDRIDMIKQLPPLKDGVSAVHLEINRNKKSLSMDLKKPEAIQIIKKLLIEYDIIIEQFRPGVMNRLGLDYQTLKKINPRLIYCSLTAYGQTGPYSTRAGHDINFLALSGISSYSGYDEIGPHIMGVQIGDISGSFYSVIGILGAVLHRNRSGKGQYIDVSMRDTTLSLSPLMNSQWFSGGDVPKFHSGFLNGGSYYGNYRTKDDKFLSIGSLEPKFFKQLASAIDLTVPEFTDPLFDESIPELIKNKIREKTLDDWINIFSELDACVEPILNLEEVEKHPQTIARESIINIKNDQNFSNKQIAHPNKYSGTTLKNNFAGVRSGEHTSQILKQVGISALEEAILREKQIVG